MNRTAPTRLRLRQPACFHAAFSLVEMLVAIMVIAILAALLFPALKMAIQTAKRATTVSHLRQLAQGTFLYAGENNGSLPDMRGPTPPGGSSSAWYGPYWCDSIRPYIYTVYTPGAYPSQDAYPVTASPFYDPLEIYHTSALLSDFGCNTSVIVPNGQPAYKLQSIISPSAIILYAMAQDATSRNRGIWYFNANGFIASGAKSGAFPSDRGTGKISFVYVDGHVETMKWQDFVDNRRTLLTYPPTP